MTCVRLRRLLMEISLSAKTPQGNIGFAREMRKWLGVVAFKALLIELTLVSGLLFTGDSTSANALSKH